MLDYVVAFILPLLHAFVVLAVTSTFTTTSTTTHTITRAPTLILTSLMIGTAPAISKLSTSVPQLLLHHATVPVPELTLAFPVNRSQKQQALWYYTCC